MRANVVLTIDPQFNPIDIQMKKVIITAFICLFVAVLSYAQHSEDKHVDLAGRWTVKSSFICYSKGKIGEEGKPLFIDNTYMEGDIYLFDMQLFESSDIRLTILARYSSDEILDMINAELDLKTEPGKKIPASNQLDNKTIYKASWSGSNDIIAVRVSPQGVADDDFNAHSYMLRLHVEHIKTWRIILFISYPAEYNNDSFGILTLEKE